MTNGQRTALIQALAFALLFAIPTSILVNAPPDATSPLTWAALGAGILGLLEAELNTFGRDLTELKEGA